MKITMDFFVLLEMLGRGILMVFTVGNLRRFNVDYFTIMMAIVFLGLWVLIPGIKNSIIIEHGP